LGLVTLQKPHPVAPILREAEAAGISSNVDLEQQVLGESAGGDSLPDVSLPDVALAEARPDYSQGEDCGSPRIAEEGCIWVRVWFMPCEIPLL
jgi:hypothetical protein